MLQNIMRDKERQLYSSSSVLAYLFFTIRPPIPTIIIYMKMVIHREVIGILSIPITETAASAIIRIKKMSCDENAIYLIILFLILSLILFKIYI